MRVAEFIPTETFEPPSNTGLSSVSIPLFVSTISAGFPSPAESALEERLSLNDLLVEHPAATFFIRVEGDSMIEAGIFSGDILVVDRATPARHGCVVVAILNGEFTVKRLNTKNPQPRLEPANPLFHPIDITEEMDFRIWGVVRYAIHHTY